MQISDIRSVAVAVGLASALLATLVVAACVAPDASRGPSADDIRIAHGGRLYDNWYAEAGSTPPQARHELYPENGEYASKGAATWRCKECHGWDYAGRDGAYASGSHATGIAGIRAMSGFDPDAIARALTSAPHGFAGHLPADDVADVARFVSRGQVDMDQVIDRETVSARGDAARGAAHFGLLCSGCHGSDGAKEEMPTLGPLARKNPWEVLHKILNGQPGTPMPALRTLDPAISADILAFVQTLQPGE